MDYDSGPYNVTFPAGATNSTFNITIHDDDIPESSETFMLAINTSTDIPCADHCQTTVTIVDNDGNYHSYA